MRKIIFATLAVAMMAGPALAETKYRFSVVPQALINPFFDLAAYRCTHPDAELPNGASFTTGLNAPHPVHASRI